MPFSTENLRGRLQRGHCQRRAIDWIKSDRVSSIGIVRHGHSTDSSVESRRYPELTIHGYS